MSDNLEFRIAKLDVRPGDCVILKINALISTEIAEKLRDQVKDRLPKGITFFVADKSVDISILRREDIERQSA